MGFIKSFRKTSFQGGHPFSDLPLILASGLGRSGTTVLRHSLAAHSGVASFNRECNYIFELMVAASKSLETDCFCEAMPVSLESYWEMHRQMFLSLYWPKSGWPKPERYEAISTYSMLDPRATIGLAESFPKLAVCYIIRNGIEVVSSYITFPAFSHLSFREVCRLWALRHDMFQYQATSEYVFLFRHEWLLGDIDKYEQQLTTALDSIGLKFDKKCLKPLRKTFHPTRFEGETSESARDPMQRKDRWKLWDDQQRETFSEVCGDVMKAQGYTIPWV